MPSPEKTLASFIEQLKNVKAPYMPRPKPPAAPVFFGPPPPPKK